VFLTDLSRHYLSPNLFLAEMNIVLFQPLAWSPRAMAYAMFLKVWPELNMRLLRQAEAAPAGVVSRTRRLDDRESEPVGLHAASQSGSILYAV